MDKLSHVDQEGRASMVDVSMKKPQLRLARASGKINLTRSTVELIGEDRIKKGNVLAVAQIAGIQAAKRTSELIPLCHPLAISKIDVKLSLEQQGVSVASEVVCVGQTGVEMEALVAVTVALLTIYDMCKAVDKNMTIDGVTLLEKTKSDV